MQKVILQILVGLHLIAFLLIGIFIHSQKRLSYISVNQEVKNNSTVGVKNNCKKDHKSTYFNKTDVRYNLGPRFLKSLQLKSCGSLFVAMAETHDIFS